MLLGQRAGGESQHKEKCYVKRTVRSAKMLWREVGLMKPCANGVLSSLLLRFIPPQENFFLNLYRPLFISKLLYQVFSGCAVSRLFKPSMATVPLNRCTLWWLGIFLFS